MAFPKRFLGFPIGWKDRGRVGNNYIGNDMIRFHGCEFCTTRYRVGIEGGVAFHFCPKCMRKEINQK